jgi:hypothetical protein
MHTLTGKSHLRFAAHAALLFTTMASASLAQAADAPRAPLAVLDALADRIYVLGETTGSAPDMIAAEAAAADEVCHYIASGATAGLLATTKDGRTPLMGAAYMGYPNVVAALLASRLVRDHIDDADSDMGMTPWIASNFSARQNPWVCNPAMLDDPYRFISTIVVQPYYRDNPTPPYRKVRELLAQAGASADMDRTKRVWHTVCKGQSADTKASVQNSADVQVTAQELGTAMLEERLRAMHKAMTGDRPGG